MKFSIITVVKNGFPNIKSTFWSLHNQTFKSYEHIILDGKSTDGTSQFLKKNINKKTVYFRQKDNGIYDALNKSFKISKGAYIIVLHSGDFFYSKNSLKLLSKFLDQNNNYDFYFSNILFYSKNKNLISRIWKIAPNHKSRLNFLKIGHTTLCVKKHISQKFFFDIKLKISADTAYILKLCKNFKGKYYNNFFIYMEDEGLSNLKKNYLQKLKEDLKILYKEFGFYCIFVYIYKILIKIPGKLVKQKKHNKKFIFEKSKLLK